MESVQLPGNPYWLLRRYFGDFGFDYWNRSRATKIDRNSLCLDNTRGTKNQGAGNQ